MVDTVFEALVSDKSFLETCNFLVSHAIRYDQQNKEKNQLVCKKRIEKQKIYLKLVLQFFLWNLN